MSHLDNIEIADNTFAIAVHYKVYDDDENDNSLSQVEEAVNEVLQDTPMLRKTEGKMMIELRPEVEWNKGKALEWLCDVVREKVDNDNREMVAVYVGDHLTEEETLRQLKEMGGIGIVLSNDDLNVDTSEASYCLFNPQELHSLFNTFLGLKPVPSSSSGSLDQATLK